MNQYFSFCNTLVASVLALAISVAALAQTQTQTQTRSAKSGGGDAKLSTPQNSKPGERAEDPAEQALTAEQLAKLKSVLAPYKAASLKVADAKLIKRTLRDAGMRRSRALDAALLAAGFDPRRLDELDPPPARPPQDGNGGGAPTKPSDPKAPK